MSRTRLAVGLTAALVTVGALSAPAGAIPPDGAGSDTPGTSSSVSPKQLRAGATISFSLSGFPAGETVSIKIDDGTTCSQASTHGACVVHKQRIKSNGTAAGQFVVPVDIKPGTHWLRYLASQEFTDANGNTGINGFTNKGGSTFTVLPKAAAPVPATKAPTKAPATAPTTTRPAVVATTPPVSASAPATASATTTPSASTSAPPSTSAVAPPAAAVPEDTTGRDPGPTPLDSTPDLAPTASEPDDDDNGAALVLGLGALVVAVAAASGFLFLRRRSS